VAVMADLGDEVVRHSEVLQTAVGFRGTVAIGFSSPSSAYNLKVIRDHPTVEYKWGEFYGVDGVLGKYGRVHEINRTGSMLANVVIAQPSGFADPVAALSPNASSELRRNRGLSRMALS
jgi:isocitrate dehydrogenase kinase/phosphatase